MYESIKTERERLTQPPYNYNADIFDDLDAESENVRKGIPVNFATALAVCNYQRDLQKIRKQKKWWQFWRSLKSKF